MSEEPEKTVAILTVTPLFYPKKRSHATDPALDAEEAPTAAWVRVQDVQESAESAAAAGVAALPLGSRLGSVTSSFWSWSGELKGFHYKTT